MRLSARAIVLGALVCVAAADERAGAARRRAAPALSPRPNLKPASAAPLIATVAPAPAAAPQAATKRARRPRLWAAVLVAWLYNFGIAVAALQQPYLFNTIFNPDGSNQPTPKSAVLYGFKKALDYLCTFMSVGAAGALSDAVGRRPLMAYASAGLGLGFLLVARSRAPSVLLLAGVIDGLSSCMGNICQAYVADLSSDDASRAKNLALLQGLSLTGAFLAGMPVSAIISSAIAKPAKAIKADADAARAAGSLARAAELELAARTHPSVAASHRAPLYIAAASQALNLLAVLVVPESRPRRAPVDRATLLRPPWKALRILSDSASLRRMGVAYLLIYVANAIMNDVITLLCGHRFGWGPSQLAPLLIAVGSILAVVPQARRDARRDPHPCARDPAAPAHSPRPRLVAAAHPALRRRHLDPHLPPPLLARLRPTRRCDHAGHPRRVRAARRGRLRRAAVHAGQARRRRRRRPARRASRRD